MKRVEINEKLVELDENELRLLFEVPPDFRLYEARVSDTGHGRMLKVSFKNEQFKKQISLSAIMDRFNNGYRQ